MYPLTPFLYRLQLSHVSPFCHFEYVVMQCSSLPMHGGFGGVFRVEVMWWSSWRMLVNRNAHVV